MNSLNQALLKPLKPLKPIKHLLLPLLLLSCAQNSKQEVATIIDTSTQEERIDYKLKFTSGVGVIFLDKNENFWFGSHREGIAKFDGDSFTYYTAEDGLADNQVRSIKEDDQGKIWIGTAHGVSSFDGNQMVNHTSEIDMQTPSPWSESQNIMWFSAGANEGAFHSDGQTVKYMAFHKPFTNSDNGHYHVTDISSGKNNMTWFATYVGVIGYNGEQFTVINNETMGYNPDFYNLHVRSILEDSKGRLWIGNNGIGILLREGDSTIHFSADNHLTSQMTDGSNGPSAPGTLEHVFAIEEDHEGNIWFGDRDTGIWRYDGENLSNYSSADGLSSDFCLDIYTDRLGRVWAGLSDGAVYVFDGKEFLRTF